ncbi:type II toxin-antitoxin system VapB family antitoxin [Brevibacterium litoralis]|uniref:type II toxin-antitoxin system VapB family antitoxin n=1 Tax=Brevibacterium litoralis TaxID=3138935 RepID=UPI0032EB2D0A
MGLNIKKSSAEEAIRELAGLTGESLTNALETAVRERLARVRTERVDYAENDNLRAIRCIIAGREASREEIDAELYDEAGLPR